MDDSSTAAIYLAGHGSKVRPRLIELQYRRIQRYRDALRDRYELRYTNPDIFVDFQLPSFGLGQVSLKDIPEFRRLLRYVKRDRYSTVFIDIDETKEGLTPDHESEFVRSMLEAAGAHVMNAFSDDRGAFKHALKNRCGAFAREYEVTDGSDVVCFFPSLAAEITATTLRRELQDPVALESGQLNRINRRIDVLRASRPYSGGGKPFIEDRLSAEWKQQSDMEKPS